MPKNSLKITWRESPSNLRMSRARHHTPPPSQLPNPHSHPFLLAVRSIQKVPSRTRTVRASMTILLPRNNERGDVIEALEGGRVGRGVPAGVPRRLVQGSGAVDR